MPLFDDEETSPFCRDVTGIYAPAERLPLFDPEPPAKPEIRPEDTKECLRMATGLLKRLRTVPDSDDIRKLEKLLRSYHAALRESWQLAEEWRIEFGREVHELIGATGIVPGWNDPDRPLERKNLYGTARRVLGAEDARSPYRED